MKRWALVLVAAVLIVIPVVFWSQLRSGNELWALLYDTGRLFSLTGFVLILIQYVLSARLKWLERGIGQDRFFIVHRLSGIVGFVLILVHPSLLFTSDLLLGIQPSLTPLKLLGLTGVLALVATAGGALLYRALKWRYETWKTVHWASYAILPIGFTHSFLLGSTVQSQPAVRLLWVVLAALYLIIVAYRVWNGIRVRQNPYQVVEVRQETHDTWSLFFEGRRFDHQPGQFLRVNLIRSGKVEPSHPFTIASSPTQPRLSISVKAVGDFTRTIGDTQVGDRAYIDAPYGAFSFLNHDADNLVFIAGGIGITPFMSMLRYLRDADGADGIHPNHPKGMRRNVLLIWGNKTERDIVFRDELEEMSARMPPDKPYPLKVIHVMSSQADWPGEKGYLDEARLKRFLDGIANPQVFVCGPPLMTKRVIRALQGLGIGRGRIHDERFSLR